MKDENAIAFLNYLQSITNKDKNYDLESISVSSITEQISKTIGLPVNQTILLNSISRLELPTKLQNPLSYSILNDAILTLQSTLKHLDLKDVVPITHISQDSFPVYGTVAMGDFSAQIKSMGTDSKPLMLFSDGLFGFANLISKVIAAGLPMISDDNGYTYSCEKQDVKSNIDSNNELIIRFIDLMLAYLLTNDPYASKQYIIDKKHFFLAETIRDSFEYFVIAHEYSHWAMGHLTTSTERGFLNLNNESISAILFNWEMEVEADALGGLLTTSIMQQKGYDLFLGSLGIWVCFNALETIEKLHCLFSEKDLNAFNFSMTHPPVSIRKSAFLNRYKDKDSVQNLFSAVDYIFESLWGYFTKFIKVLKDFTEGINLDIKNMNFFSIQKLLYRIHFV